MFMPMVYSYCIIFIILSKYKQKLLLYFVAFITELTALQTKLFD